MSIHSRLIAIGLCLCSVFVQAQEADEAAESTGWYQVHLAVFEHRGGSGEFEEMWRNQLHLQYPDELIRLKSRERYLTDLCGTPPEVGEAAVGGAENRLMAVLEQVDGRDGDELRPHARPLGADPTHPDCRERRPDLFPQDENDAADARADVVVAEAASLVGDGGAQDSGTAPEPFEPPTPFILEKGIPDEEFAEIVKKLRGAYRYRVLFAGSWPQPLKAREAAPALLIQGGEEVGKHYQLEGYIKVALERYLHIDTDLWLSEFAELPQWAREQQNRQLIIDEASGQNRSTMTDDGPGAANHNAGNWAPTNEYAPGGSEQSTPNRINEFPALPLPFPINDPAHRLPERRDIPAMSDNGMENPAARADVDDQAWSGRARDLPSARPSSNLDLLNSEDSSYYVERTVVMRQNRRIRSGEVHYIDHPMFGLVVKITPLPAPKKGADAD